MVEPIRPAGAVLAPIQSSVFISNLCCDVMILGRLRYEEDPIGRGNRRLADGLVTVSENPVAECIPDVTSQYFDAGFETWD